MKSLSLSTPDVRIKRSRGGSEAVKRWELMVAELMSSGFLYCVGDGGDLDKEDRGLGVGEPV